MTGDKRKNSIKDQVEERQQLFFWNSYPYPLLVMNKKGDILFVNEAGQKAFELVDDHNHFLPKQLDSLKKIAMNYLKKKVNEQHFLYQNTNGLVTDFLVKISSLKNKKNGLLVLYFQDISQQIIYEKLLATEKELLSLIIKNT